MRANRLAACAVLVASVATLLMVATGALAQDPSAGSPYVLPTPTPEPTPTATPDEDEDEERPRLRLLSPTPTVRIIGRLTRDGARVTRLTVRTPPLTRIVVRCSGGKRKGCPAVERTTVVPDRERRLVTYRLKRFERTYAAGAKLELAIARKGTIGKYASFAIRRGKAPRRRDACIDYGATKPRACPALDR